MLKILLKLRIGEGTQIHDNTKMHWTAYHKTVTIRTQEFYLSKPAIIENKANQKT